MPGDGDVIILNYHDTILRQSDVNILKTPSWLSDSIVGFYLEYLGIETYSGNGILFICPEVTQCVKMCDAAEVPVFLDPLKTREHDFVFMPLNDADDRRSPNGTHWSLIMFSRPDSLFYHLDSLTPSNATQSYRLAQNVGDYFCNSSLDQQVVQFTSLQQDNYYDCGIYMLCNVDNLAKHVSLHRHCHNAKLISKAQVTAKRSELLHLIEQLKLRPN